MKTEHVTIFSGSFIIVKGLQNRLDSINIGSIIKDRVESARLGGFGEHRTAVELLILKSDIEKAQTIIDTYAKEINS
ncbi:MULTISPECIES: DUF2007 domain-containing protein [Polaribacter]|uniref:DUF2007 domain-containing protein n=1 Tax=Polaribacter marinaquae TaxID=1642819 RepID=A0ABZ2TUU5_9FLAO|nr:MULTISPECIES: DUF2007 domain-containing protein [unclassified Polaribacter]AQS95067.1 hypothetical protein BXQ17_13690 [Polaribacter sp. BM10]SHN00132.1 Putative signal transducing protein [Polaribacter sp. KT 15]